MKTRRGEEEEGDSDAAHRGDNTMERSGSDVLEKCLGGDEGVGAWPREEPRCEEEGEAPQQ